ncbi:YeeE/YedE thiosulfate transporter family protein [Oleiagrimonas sp.]|jgi:uncharacterized membrane protein YedE/YeeE|uniref:YeeE/YedE family protein n=1 Tax=Oleiagrimonas sp. TaxID=2010330 RepID=UPI002639328B|nr:YeeE/YedE thiosulfate transporter family protein [Oleiagrimonas sp.]MDA3914694.1 YeeE/YedE thiosulfate transporter family protein [Oleiagrimonas sp.]
MSPWIQSLSGGVLIGLSAVLLLATLGRIAGISGIAGGLVTGAHDRAWRLAFVLGLVLAGGVLWLLTGRSGIGSPQVSLPWMLAAGLLVGVGTRLGSGCTSGHGVCGIARLSRVSVMATVVFMLTGILTVYMMRHVWVVGL